MRALRCSSSLFTALLVLLLDSALSFIPEIDPIRIDCGNPDEGYFDETTNLQWSKDQYFASGLSNVISQQNNAGGKLANVDSTLRVWSTGDSCYYIPVIPGRYLVRLSFAYNDYDKNYYQLYQSNGLPSIGVLIQDYFLEEVGGFKFNSTAYYTDYVVFVETETISICFTPFNQQPSFVNSIQVLPVDTQSLFSADTGNVSLSNWKRINSGGDSFGVGDGDDEMYRSWMGDIEGDDWRQINASNPVEIPDTYRYNHLPAKLFNTCREAVGDHTGYNFTNIHPVDSNNSFLVILYFVEYNDTIGGGDRKMNLWVNGENATIDLLDENPGSPYLARMWLRQVHLGGDPSSENGGWISVIVSQGQNATLPPILCGVEVYEIINPLPVAVNNESDTSIRIDCGSQGNYTDEFGFTWMGDFGYSSGNSSIVVASNNTLDISQTLRFFPYPKQNCYMLPVSLSTGVSTPRFFVRLFFNYGNYDTVPAKQKGTVPFFNVSLQGTIITSVYPETPGYFIDAITYVEDEMVQICLQGNSKGPPTIINSIEIYEVNPLIYGAGKEGSGIILYNYYRLNCGGTYAGDMLSTDKELGHRQWTPDIGVKGVETEFPDEGSYTRYFEEDIKDTGNSPNFFPSFVFQTARVGSKQAIEGGRRIMAYDFLYLDNGTDILIVLHFAELFGGIKSGERVFDVSIVLQNGTEISIAENLDLVKEVGLLVPKTIMFNFKIGDYDNTFELRLMRSDVESVVYDPVISGIEVYRVVKMNFLTVPDQQSIMESFRDSLQVGEWLNWQGDPCSPTPWSGVTCVESTSEQFPNHLAIESINLSGQNLVGSIPQVVGGLIQLKSLNLSNNMITGNIPDDLSDMNIEEIDLSRNQIDGLIPERLGQNDRLRLLNLSYLDITGPIPDTSSNPDLVIDLSNNPYLCDSPGLPSCSSINATSTDEDSILPTIGSSDSKGKKSGAPIGAIVGGIVAVALLGLAISVFLYYHRRHGYSPAASSDLPTPSSNPPTNTNIFGARRKPSKTHGFYILERGRAMTPKEPRNMSNIV